MKFRFQTAQFLGSMLKVEETVRDDHGNLIDEIVIVGRSNVGKSSLINHLLHHKGLARVSSTPGKTTLLNFYKIDNNLVLVDLPGYGYAARSRGDQFKWSENIDLYFRERKTLKLILLLVDSRREMSREDLEIIEWASHHHKPLLLICTKSDTIKPQDRKDYPGIPTMHYSIKDGRSRTALISKINHLLG
jgi:GTP-binding protein